MTTYRLIPPLNDAEQIAAVLSDAAARQPDMALIRAAVARRHPHMSDAEQEALAAQVASAQRRATVTVGFNEQGMRVQDAPLGAAGGAALGYTGAAAVATIDLAKDAA